MREIKDYLHLYGVGAPISTIDGEGSVLSVHANAVKVSLNKISLNQELHGFTDGNGGLHRTYLFKSFQCKLILRPLSDMTEEEVNELWVKLDLNPNYELHLEGRNTKRQYITEYFTREPVWPANYERFDFKQNCILIHYLLSKHFDLFGLIESGLAIDSTLNTPTTLNK